MISKHRAAARAPSLSHLQARVITYVSFCIIVYDYTTPADTLYGRRCDPPARHDKIKSLARRINSLRHGALLSPFGDICFLYSIGLKEIV